MKVVGFLLVIGSTLLVFNACDRKNDKIVVPVCDTLQVGYAAQIKPILKSNCYTCHGSNSNEKSGGIDLENYQVLKVFAQNGYLYGNILHLPFPYHAMPAVGKKLTDCEIAKIKAWINKGYPED